MPSASLVDERLRDELARDAGLAIVTLGLYMPYWFWRKNEDLRASFPTLTMPSNLVLVVSGAAIAIAGPAMFGWWAPVYAAVLNAIGLVLFLVGGYLLADNARAASELAGVDLGLDPRLFALGLGLGWFGVILGDLVPWWPLRATVILLLLTQPYWFWRLAVGLWRIRERLAGSAPANPPPSDVTTRA